MQGAVLLAWSREDGFTQWIEADRHRIGVKGHLVDLHLDRRHMQGSRFIAMLRKCRDRKSWLIGWGGVPGLFCDPICKLLHDARVRQRLDASVLASGEYPQRVHAERAFVRQEIHPDRSSFHSIDRGEHAESTALPGGEIFSLGERQLHKRNADEQQWGHRSGQAIDPLLGGAHGLLMKDGRGDTIRTCDFQLPKLALYQAELRPDLSRFGKPILAHSEFKLR